MLVKHFSVVDDDDVAIASSSSSSSADGGDGADALDADADGDILAIFRLTVRAEKGSQIEECSGK